MPRRVTVYNKEAIDRFMADYCEACQGEDQNDHPNPKVLHHVLYGVADTLP